MPGLIYGLREIGSSEFRYVGRTVTTDERRLRKHFSASRCGTQSYVAHWIRKSKYQVECVVLEDDPADLCAAEIQWIAEMRKEGHRLTNLSDGGDGGGLGNRGRTGQPLPPEHKAKISVARKGQAVTAETTSKMVSTRRSNNSYQHSDATRKTLSVRNSGESNPMYGRRPWCHGKTLSVETKEKMSEARRRWWQRRKEALTQSGDAKWE